MSIRSPLNKRAEVLRDTVYRATKLSGKNHIIALKTAHAQVVQLDYEIKLALARLGVETDA